ncbi:metallo-beta-lactamase class B [Hydrogenispora ethanolica]|jgi:metallo-beta-lactamase class B|uniref:beta-lactamase n=1 Tax=Hydrogenispora ethanolica TaxID=1082276 RepID=A0A4R1SA99_HYDET|nr:subclass B1 metallo-beta-lactamase [Hydrogenispora ethanolica]TCL76433.1 metallo-beta-lactamase class B [Hydrogenispora ethanolica]
MKRILLLGMALLCLALPVRAGGTDRTIELAPVADRIWMHTTYFPYNGQPTPSNGLLVETGEGLVLIDTPWTDPQTEALLELAAAKFHQPVLLAVITHAHTDRIGGIATLLQWRIRTVSTALTAQLAAEAGYPRPEAAITAVTQVLEAGGMPLEVYYPGPAHTRDNITVYLPRAKVLFGGCIVKSLASRDLGNVADGDAAQYPETLRKLMRKYPEARAVVPGHGAWGGPELLRHTLALAER